MNACKVAAAGCALALGAEAVVGGSALATAGATLPVAAGVSELTVQACTGAAVICGVAGAEELGQNVFTKEKGEAGTLEKTPASNPKDFGPIRGRKAKVNKETGEIWEKDLLHKDHWEVYKNKRDFEDGVRDRAIWGDGRFKNKF